MVIIKTIKIIKIIKINNNNSMYIPYAALHKSPITFYIGKVPVTLSLCDQQTSLVSIPRSFEMEEANQQISNVKHVKMGSSFVLEYKGIECEVRLGRRIVLMEGGGYILL